MVKFSSSRNKKSMKKRNLLIAILIVAMLAFSVAGTYIFMYFSSGKIQQNTRKLMQHLSQINLTIIQLSTITLTA